MLLFFFNFLTVAWRVEYFPRIRKISFMELMSKMILFQPFNYKDLFDISLFSVFDLTIWLCWCRYNKQLDVITLNSGTFIFHSVVTFFKVKQLPQRNTKQINQRSIDESVLTSDRNPFFFFFLFKVEGNKAAFPPAYSLKQLTNKQSNS